MEADPRTHDYARRAAQFWPSQWEEYIPLDNVAKALRLPKRAIRARADQDGRVVLHHLEDGWYVKRQSAALLLAERTLDPT